MDLLEASGISLRKKGLGDYTGVCIAMADRRNNLSYCRDRTGPTSPFGGTKACREIVTLTLTWGLPTLPLLNGRDI